MNSSAKKLQRSLTSKEIRKTFIDYFINNHEHKWVRSSPIVPYCDSTLAFVNAGMNQFKSIFLGKTQPQYKRVTNSQKCVRVGGKHNDLNVVGQDGYHHTFFEMLGNWSFGDYYKREACSMALELLHGSFNIDPNRLYVTYFAGDKVLGLPADLECFEIWKSLGFPEYRILPFGSTENFWEMGSNGPCGPSSEIHIDHYDNCVNPKERAKCVNAGQSDLTELWNLVFIEYNRQEDGTIVQLPTKHVDTGMGFERLTAVLQNKSSNYDTDLFEPIFYAIHKSSKVLPYNGSYTSNTDITSLDTAYRILADHARMVSVCLADDMLPDQNQKLRRVLRRALLLTEQTFADEKLLNKLVPIVADTLATAYPELLSKQHSIAEIIDHEREVYKALRRSSTKAFNDLSREFPHLHDVEMMMECPGFVQAYHEFQQTKSSFQHNTIPGEFLYKLNGTYGFTKENICKLAELENMQCDWLGYQKALTKAKQRSKGLSDDQAMVESSIEKAVAELTKTLKPTNDQYKYDYYYDSSTGEYSVPAIKTTILGILYNDIHVNEVITAGANSSTDSISIITSSSNFYYEGGGQESDKGWLLASHVDPNTTRKLKIVNVRCVNDCVVHVCELCTENGYFTFACGDEVFLKVDAKRRKGNICHHTAVHLLNATIRSLFKKVTYQVSSSVTSDYGKLEVGLIGKQLTSEDIVQTENLIREVISNAVPIQKQLCSANEIWHDNDIIRVPGEIYPEYHLSLITIHCDDLNLLSKELCCGTHARNTQELEHFCITQFKQVNAARYAFTVAAGDAAAKVLDVARLLENHLNTIEKDLDSKGPTNAVQAELQRIRHNLLHMDIALPYTFKLNTLQRINELLRKLKNFARTNIKEFVEIEMRNLLHEKPLDKHPFVLHYITSSALMDEEVPLYKATKLCTDRPILVISLINNMVKARCCVPKQYQTTEFTAQGWLQVFANVFKAEIAAPRGQDPDGVCNMKGKKVSTQFEEQLEIAMEHANNYAKKFLL